MLTDLSREMQRFPYVWRWHARLPERQGQRCRVVCRGTLNSCMLEFPDGFRVVTSRNGLRRARPDDA